MQTLLVYAGLVAAPSAAFVLARRAAVRWSTGGGRRRRPRPAAPVEQVLPGLTQRLRRLDDEFVRLQGSASPGAATRLRALALTYDDTLRDCCRVLALPDPGPPPLAAAARLRVEADLAHRGVEW